MLTASQRMKPLELFQGEPAPRLCDQLIGVPRVRHYSPRTEEVYVHWIRRRVTMTPRAVVRPLQEHLKVVETVHQQDVADGFGRVELPHALARKYPNANRTWIWQYVFPQERRWRNARTAEQGRHHLHESLAPKSIAKAVRAAELTRAGAKPHFPPLVRNTPFDGWLRHPHDTGTPGAQGCENYNDLHARIESRRTRRSQSGRPTATAPLSVIDKLPNAQSRR